MTVRALLAACLVTLALAGCGDSGGGSSYGGPPAAATSPTDPAPASTDRGEPDRPATGQQPKKGPDNVPETLQFTATTLDGSDFDGATLAGKPTLLWFWAPWCPVCQSQVPEVEAVAAEYGDRVNVVGVGGLDSGSAIEDFADDVEGLTHLVDEDGTVWQRFGVTEQSSYILLDADGDEVLSTGYDEDVDMQARVAELVG